MKKILKYSCLICILIFSSLLAGCWLFDYSEESGANYVSAVFTKSDCNLSWSSSANVNTYDVIVNDEVVATYPNDKDKYTYNIKDSFEEGRLDYTFYIEGHTTTRTIVSDTFRYTKASANVVETNNEYEIDINKSPKNVSEVDQVIVWDAVPDVKNYVVVLIGGQNDISYYSTTSNSMDLSEYTQDDKVYSFRVGAQYSGDSNLYLGSGQYVNTEDAGVDDKYLDTIYYFAGEYHDLYINDQDELNNVVYYAFIYKIESINFAVNPVFMRTSTNYASYIEKASDNIHETCNYTISRQAGADNTLTLTFNYYGIVAPSKSTGSSVKGVNLVDPYYEGRDIASNLDFASDNSLIEVSANSSEELAWAIEYGATPIMDTDSVAYEIYNEAKDILNSIVSEDMTDYEKCLSIFDWISANTTYDHKIVSAISVSPDIAVKYKCFYLEGVFFDGLAVCDGYSKAYSLMTNMIGIPCVRISGTASSGGSTGGHAWNKVAVDMDGDGTREWYVVDITWANLSLEYEKTDIEVTSHSYFMVSDKTIEDTHTPLSDADNGKPALCSANYYEQMTFESYGTVHNFVVDDYLDVIAIGNYVKNTGKACEVIVLGNATFNQDCIALSIDGYDYIYNATSTYAGDAGTIVYVMPKGTTIL